MQRNTVTLAAIAALLMLTSAATTARAVPLMDFTGGSLLTANNTTVGYQFSTSVPFTVTDFALFDAGANGFLASHSITLYTNAGATILSTNIAAGTVAPLLTSVNTLGDFRTVDVPDFTLAPGTYVLASFAVANAESCIGNAVASPTTGVTYLENRVLTDSNGFPSAVSPLQEQAYMGPSLISTVAVVPEANTVLLAALALPVIGFVAARRKK